MLPALMVPDQVVSYVTPDGWRGELRRYRAEGPPVLLVHGMGANHRNWDLDPRISLVDELQQAGWDTFVAVLPGDPGTRPPSLLDAEALDFTLLATVHLPALVDRVLEVNGAEQLFWVGHSMGAMLLYSNLGDPRIAGGVAIAGAGQFEDPPLLVRLGRGIRGNSRDNAGLAERFAWTLPFNPVVGLLARRRHLDGALTRELVHHALQDSPRGVVHEVVDYTRSGPFTDSRTGEPLVDFTATTPVLALSGTRDRVVSHEDARTTCNRLPECTFVPLQAYGHVDPVVGITADRAVYPRLLDWLAAHR